MAIGAGTGGYARGINALGICERCSIKTLRRLLTYDGQFPDLLVCDECWDPKHPQEYLVAMSDPVTIYDSTGDPDRAAANRLIIPYPPLINGEVPVLDLRISFLIHSFGVQESAGGAAGDSYSQDGFDILAFDTDAYDL